MDAADDDTCLEVDERRVLVPERSPHGSCEAEGLVGQVAAALEQAAIHFTAGIRKDAQVKNSIRQKFCVPGCITFGDAQQDQQSGADFSNHRAVHHHACLADSL